MDCVADQGDPTDGQGPIGTEVRIVITPMDDWSVIRIIVEKSGCQPEQPSVRTPAPAPSICPASEGKPDRSPRAPAPTPGSLIVVESQGGGARLGRSVTVGPPALVRLRRVPHGQEHGATAGGRISVRPSSNAAGKLHCVAALHHLAAQCDGSPRRPASRR